MPPSDKKHAAQSLSRMRCSPAPRFPSLPPFRCRPCFLGTLPVILLSLSLAPTSEAQQSMLGGVEPGVQYPSQQYYLALEVYRDGELEQAAEAFDHAMRMTRKDIHGQWIDAIPVYAMLAECFWQMGNLPACQANLDQALRIAIQYRGWLAQPDWESAIRGNVQLAPERGLWPAAASLRRVPLNDRMMFRAGEILTPQTLLRGGAIEEPNIKVIDVVEVMRGLAIASYRRRVLLGPISERDPLASGLLDATKYPAGLQLPLARTLIGALRVSERFGNFEDDRVIAEASQTSTIGGAVHPLTPITLLSSASALAGSEKPGDAVAVAIQAAAAAAALGQPEWIGEAMQLAAGCAGGEGAAAVRQASEVAAQAAARDRGSRLAALHCSITAADAAVTAGQLGDAGPLLAGAQAITSRRRVAQPRMQAYWGLTSARLAAARGESGAGGTPSGVDSGLALFNAFALNSRFRNRPIVSMPGIYQMELLRGSIGETVGGNRGEALLERYVMEPPIEVWRRDLADALALTVADRTALEAAWIGQAAQRSDGRELLRRIDYVQGSRFLRQLPLAGRLVQLRQLASGDEARFPAAAQAFLAKPPRLFPLFRQAVAGPNPEDLGGVLVKAGQLESAAWTLALDRSNLPRTAPPPLAVEDVGVALPARTGMLSFFFVGNQLYGLLAGDGKTVSWAVPAAARLPRDIGSLLRAIGVGKTRGNRLPENDQWRKEAEELRARLIPDDTAVTADRFDELVVVPDGPLWYLPLEILPIADAGGPSIGESMKVRYAATPGLAIHPVGGRTPRPNVGIVSRGFFAPRDRDADDLAVASVTEGIDDAVQLPGSNPVPGSLLGSSIGHLLVAVPQTPDLGRPLSLPVAAYDASQPAGTLAAWIRFPTAAPQSVILAGFRTPVDVGKLGTGQELFLTVCGLQTAGVRDVMVSRWAVGGLSTATLMRELMQELPHTGMSDAWHRARDLLQQTELNPAAEPLLSQGEQKRQGVTGREPLFWAGYLLASPLELDAGP